MDERGRRIAAEVAALHRDLQRAEPRMDDAELRRRVDALADMFLDAPREREARRESDAGTEP